jgi:hypothetical protein
MEKQVVYKLEFLTWHKIKILATSLTAAGRKLDISQMWKHGDCPQMFLLQRLPATFKVPQRTAKEWNNLFPLNKHWTILKLRDNKIVYVFSKTELYIHIFIYLFIYFYLDMFRSVDYHQAIFTKFIIRCMHPNLSRLHIYMVVFDWNQKLCCCLLV